MVAERGRPKSALEVSIPENEVFEAIAAMGQAVKELNVASAEHCTWSESTGEGKRSRKLADIAHSLSFRRDCLIRRHEDAIVHQQVCELHKKAELKPAKRRVTSKTKTRRKR